MNIKLSLILFIVLVYSCIEPLDSNFKGDRPTGLVVDGLITNEPGPYVVYLSRTSEYNSTSENTVGVVGAIVTISDDMGNSEILTETYFPGIYKTDPNGIRGVTSRNYKLEIETAEGEQYESNPELLGSVSDIEAVYYERQEFQEIAEDNTVSTFEGFQIFIDTKDPSDHKNYYMWSCTGTYEIHTQPWNFFDIKRRVIDPKDCCAVCWINERFSNINVLDDRVFAGTSLQKKPVSFIRIRNSDRTRHFRGKYHVEVNQLSLTKEAYRYWSSIEEQISSTGSIFEPAPGIITGNIRNINDPEEAVFGFFGASSVSTLSVFIPADEVEYSVSDTLIWPDDCRVLPNSTAVKPPFW